MLSESVTSSNSYSVPLAKELASTVAVRLGVPFAEAWRVVDAMGEAMLDLLRDGRAVGIPHLGLSLAVEACQRRRVCNLLKGDRLPANAEALAECEEVAVRRHLRVHVPERIKRHLRQCAAVGPPISVQARDARRRSGGRSRRQP